MRGTKYHARADSGLSLVENGCGLDRATPVRQGFDSAPEEAKDVGQGRAGARNAGRVLQPLGSRQCVAHMDERGFKLAEGLQSAAETGLDVDKQL